MEVSVEKTGKVLAGMLRQSPVAAVIIAVIGSFTFLLWERPDLQKFFLELFNAQTIPLFALAIVMGAMYLSNGHRIRYLEQQVIAHKIEADKHEVGTDICRLEQTLMRSAFFNIGIIAAKTESEKELVMKIVHQLDRDLELIPAKAKLLFHIRRGGPEAGGDRHDDPAPP